MIIAKLFGGLGNQLFIYAAAKSLSIEYGVDLRFDTSEFSRRRYHSGLQLNYIFGLEIKDATQEDIEKILGYRGRKLFRDKLSNLLPKAMRAPKHILEVDLRSTEDFYCIGGDCYLVGYFQSEQYFQRHSDSVVGQMKFRPLVSARNISLRRTIDATNSVSIHVRRGDYLVPENLAIHGICGQDYYEGAVEFIRERVESPKFFIFSDDPEWVRSNIFFRELGAEIVDWNIGNDSYIDLHLMSQCKDNIIANSTFSWWGAYLNSNPNKLIVSPLKWFQGGSIKVPTVPSSWKQI